MAIVQTGCMIPLLLIFSGPALGQSSTQVFAGGGVMLNEDRTWGDATTNLGVSVSGGVVLKGRTELRMTVEVPPVTTLTSSHTTYDGNPPVVSGHVITRARGRNRTVASLVGRVFSVHPRVSITPAIGWSSSQRVDATRVTVVRIGDGTTQELPSEGSSTWGGPAFAVGGRVAVTGHLSLGPDARLVWYPFAESGNKILRLAVETRWTFW